MRGTCFPNQSSSSEEILGIVNLCNGTPSDLRLVTKDFKANMKPSGGRPALGVVRKCSSDTFQNDMSLWTASVANKLNILPIMFLGFEFGLFSSVSFSQSASISERNAAALVPRMYQAV